MIYAATCCGFYPQLQQFLVVGFWHPSDWTFGPLPVTSEEMSCSRSGRAAQCSAQ